MNWANPEQYAEAKKIVEANGLDIKNPYIYEKVLKAQGYDVFMGDLNPWIKANAVEVEIDLTLGATA